MINFADYNIDMWNEEKIISFRRTLLAWYDNEKRDLPWRRTKNPYHIWVSEIMLQQTQVVTVIPYYERFLSWFPTIESLALASEEKLLKAWEGLGYYSRVRNMQVAAREIMEKFHGKFPCHYKDILSLKGIGPYTAGAIASIAFGLPEPAVDGNVMRVMARLFEIDYDISDSKNRNIFQSIMKVLIDPERPGDFNQALMDLGTDIESAKNPRPEESPIRFFNAAYLHGTYDKYPIKLPKQKPKPIAIQAFVIRNHNGDFLLEKNTNERLLGGFWSFPIIESTCQTGNSSQQSPNPTISKQIFTKDYQMNPTWTTATFANIKHTFSHQKWTINMNEGNVASNHLTPNKKLCWVSQEQLSNYPMATPQKKMLAVYLNAKQTKTI